MNIRHKVLCTELRGGALRELGIRYFIQGQKQGACGQIKNQERDCNLLGLGDSVLVVDVE